MSHNNITTSYDSIADQLIDSDYQYFISRYISEKGLRTIYEKIIQTHKEYLDNIISRMMSFFLHETSREYDWNCGSFFQHIPSEILFSKIPVEISLRTRLYESIGINWCLGEFMLSDERVITFLEDTVANAKNSESWWRAAFSMEKMGLINAINYLKSDLKSKHVPSLQECLPLDNKRLVIGLLLHSNINNLQKIILPTIKNILRKKNPHEPSHLNAAWLAGRYRFRDNQVEQILHKNLYHESYEVVFYTLRAIVEIGSIEFKDDLIKLLDREEHHLQIMAADGLAKLNCLDLIKPLRKRLLDESRPDVISSITRAFYLLTNFSERKKTFIRNNISANENGMIADEGDKWYVNPYIYHEFSSSQDPENLCFSLIKEVLRGFLWSGSPKTDSSPPRRLMVRIMPIQINRLVTSNSFKVTLMRR